MSVFSLFKKSPKKTEQKTNMSSTENVVITENNDDMERLVAASKENKFMTLEGNKYTAKIVYIYDGDTIHCVFKEFGKLYKWNCRIMNVDTPELRTKNLKEKEMGYKVRDILHEKLLEKIVTIHTYEFDKYGRLLIDVELPDENNKLLSTWLIENKYAYEYHGGTKQSW